MSTKTKLFLVITAIVLLGVSSAYSNASREGQAKIVRRIVTSDTILSGMIISLLPQDGYSVEAILPPGQCPGHYDVKLSDIEKMKKADLNVSFRGMSFLKKTIPGEAVQVLVDAGGRNWMAPDSYIYGLGFLAEELSKHFPEDKDEIMRRKEETIRKVRAVSSSLVERIKQAGISGKPLLASSLQKEVLEWMGFRVVGEYGRPESTSTREVVRLSKTGKDQHVMAIVDNLQSGPDAGKGIAETLGVPHVVLTNFPSEEGYLATLRQNVDAVVAAVTRK
jgi:zinc transport system substrate-binding protein